MSHKIDRDFTRWPSVIIRPAEVVHFSSSSRLGISEGRRALALRAPSVPMVGSAEPLAVHGAYGVVADRAEFADAHTVVRARATSPRSSSPLPSNLPKSPFWFTPSRSLTVSSSLLPPARPQVTSVGNALRFQDTSSSTSRFLWGVGRAISCFAVSVEGGLVAYAESGSRDPTIACTRWTPSRPSPRSRDAGGGLLRGDRARLLPRRSFPRRRVRAPRPRPHPSRRARGRPGGAHPALLGGGLDRVQPSRRARAPRHPRPRRGPQPTPGRHAPRRPPLPRRTPRGARAGSSASTPSLSRRRRLSPPRGRPSEPSTSTRTPRALLVVHPDTGDVVPPPPRVAESVAADLRARGIGVRGRARARTARRSRGPSFPTARPREGSRLPRRASRSRAGGTARCASTRTRARDAARWRRRFPRGW